MEEATHNEKRACVYIFEVQHKREMAGLHDFHSLSYLGEGSLENKPYILLFAQYRGESASRSNSCSAVTSFRSSNTTSILIRKGAIYFSWGIPTLKRRTDVPVFLNQNWN